MSLNEADEILLLAFLRRARAALKESDHRPGNLGVLEWADLHNVHRPAFVQLAAEWDVKFRADLNTFLGANAEGKVPFHFRTLAVPETDHWHLEDTPLAPLMPFPIFGLYMIREGDRFRSGDFLENIFCYPREPEDAPKNRYGQTPLEAYFDGGEGATLIHLGDDNEGVDWTDPDKMDANPFYSERHTFEADIGDLVLPDDDSQLFRSEDAREVLLDKLAEQATEGAREWFSGNTVHPRAVLEGVKS
jgi:hypothetical protein